MKISLKETAAKLLSADSLVITSHVNPDGDALGSSLALYQMMIRLGKRAELLIDDDIPEAFSFLPDIAAIKKPEAESYDADLLVMLDVSRDRIGRVAEKCRAPILNIDHHITNDGEADFLYLDAGRAATAEIVYQLARELAVEPDEAVAMCIYTGISTDTGNFKFSNTTPFTMRAAADMLEAGAKAHIVSEALEQRSYQEVMDKAKAMQTIELAFDGRVAGIYIDNALYETIGSTEGFIDTVRIIAGVDAAVLVKEVEAGRCRISMRSKGMDVSRIAAAFQGGGHIRAAGCSIEKPLAEAKEMLLQEIGKAL
ncbi:MAG: bifunctional oligoribonuclease/PAP phosphatase NrnA [Anaerovibrio sp.]|nr:bifunctional oligoribonuclease/PAP phosphatase NrnA [Anaerovibrio sp.]